MSLVSHTLCNSRVCINVATHKHLKSGHRLDCRRHVFRRDGVRHTDRLPAASQCVFSCSLHFCTESVRQRGRILRLSRLYQHSIPNFFRDGLAPRSTRGWLHDRRAGDETQTVVVHSPLGRHVVCFLGPFATLY